MKGCFASLGLMGIHVVCSAVAGITVILFSGSVLAALLIVGMYWIGLARYFRMGSQYLFNAGVAVTILNAAFGWAFARSPAYIGLRQFLKGDWDRAEVILSRAEENRPDDTWIRLARLRLGEQTGDTETVKRVLEWLHERPGKGEFTEILELQVDIAAGTIANVSPQVDALLERYPRAVHLRGLRAQARLAGGDIAGGEEDARAVVDAYAPRKYGWIVSPIGHVESRLLLSRSELTLCHLSRLRGDEASARIHAQRAWSAFSSATFVFTCDAAGVKLLAPEYVLIGNQTYSWLQALMNRPEDKKIRDGVTSQARQTLKNSLFDLSSFSHQHMRNGTAPTPQEELIAQREAHKRKFPPQ